RIWEIQAAAIPGLFNTGVDAFGTPQGNLATELHYVLMSVPGGVTSLRVATAANSFPINGVSTGQTGAGFFGFTGFAINSGFVFGTTTIVFIINNGGAPTGLRVEMTGTASPVTGGVPEPASLVLMGAGLAGFALYRRRQ